MLGLLRLVVIACILGGVFVWISANPSLHGAQIGTGGGNIVTFLIHMVTSFVNSAGKG